MSLSVPLEPPSKEILHISAHYLVILVKYIYSIQFNSILCHLCDLLTIRVRDMTCDSDVIEKPSRRWRGAVQQLADVVWES